MPKDGEYTLTQQAMLQVLSDGEPHSRKELHACLPDSLGLMSNIRRHLSAIRKVLRSKDEDIVCQWHKKDYYYRHIKLLSPKSEQAEL